LAIEEINCQKQEKHDQQLQKAHCIGQNILEISIEASKPPAAPIII
jgi:hypothetical protein